MASVAVVANCQGTVLTNLINACLSGYHADYFSNNYRSGGFSSDVEVLGHLSRYDILLYQPLEARHGCLSQSSLQSAFPDKTHVRFTYVFNSGTSTLGYAPLSQKNSYGEVYGENSVIEMIDAGLSKEQIATRLESGEYSPSITSRFERDLNVFADRELRLELQISAFLEARYREEPLFITHNHPTFPVFAELFLRFVRFLEPRRLVEARTLMIAARSSIADLPSTGGAVTPHDARSHGYRFGYHSDWRQKNAHLIDLVWQAHKEGKAVAPAIYPSSITLPDTPL